MTRLTPRPSSPDSQDTSNIPATKIELYVPVRTPTSSTINRGAMVGPPNSRSATITVTIVKEVLRDLPTVSLMLRLTISISDDPWCRIRFSRMRSKTTIVSFTL